MKVAALDASGALGPHPANAIRVTIGNSTRRISASALPLIAWLPPRQGRRSHTSVEDTLGQERSYIRNNTCATPAPGPDARRLHGGEACPRGTRLRGGDSTAQERIRTPRCLSPGFESA